MSDPQSTVPAGFRAIPGYTGYAINEHGTILSIRKKGFGANKPHLWKDWKDAKRLSTTPDQRGYLKVKLSRDGKSCNPYVHYLVLVTFTCPRPDGMKCRHLDGNPSNNHVSNLAWGTDSENEQDKVLHGTSNRGERHGDAKLTSSDVLEIRASYENGESQKVLAKDFGVAQTNISLIVRRKSWTHI